ncbi:RecQ family ATP-dependent DNA helicase [Shewanella acanthi]|uniref:RecQ family ATP-dependent DNA helicase n=1 Tax=Shewanella acanthi TaxID=2864212 RepID=UPI001C661555|nr:RecQ family ATP-dependent DNA helicase [Shewanella acanthi]QYJ77423.1 RecQ family ATP-dependent DNA helicase [Shewanella acanthi]
MHDDIRQLNQQLATQFGFDGFREGQFEVVTQLLAGQSSLAIFPTGSGKSLCYQFTALQLPHLTLVVSPLLALIKDQLAFLHSKGINAASIDSTLSHEDAQQVMRDARSGKLKLLMVSVERFKNERFRQFIESIPISMLVVDEAHCISEWGHNFRPDYLKLPIYREQLNIPLVLLLTATATRKVKLDMAKRFAIEPQHIVQTGFYRANLDLNVLSVPSHDKIAQLKQQISGLNGAGIVYVTLQNTAEEVAQALIDAGIHASAYHAGFDDTKRQHIQQAFMEDKVRVVVATIAFGMGIDKRNIRFVIHYDLPKSIENYCQEIGRAGRDGELSHCITLANLDGINTVENFVYGDTPELSSINQVLTHIREAQIQSPHAPAPRWEVQLLRLSDLSNIRQLPLKTLLVQLEMQGAIKPLYAYSADVRYRFIADKTAILAMFNPERQQFLTQIFQHTDMKRVWGNVDFNGLYDAQGIERARVLVALEYLADKQLIELEAKGMTEVFEVNPSAIDNPELGELLHDYFSKKAGLEIARIAQLVRFFELSSCLNYNLACYFDDGAAPSQCGHCSVCRGHIATLTNSSPMAWPSDDVLKADLMALSKQANAKGIMDISLETQCRFLAGMTLPILSKIQARKLAGFGRCESQRYSQIKHKVTSIMGEG